MCIALCGKGLAGCWYFDNIFMHMFAYVCTFVYIYSRECKHDMAYVACFLIGFVMLALGIGGFISLGMIVKDWTPARGVVERIESERVYKYRKMRWEHRVDVRYETVEFGEMYTSKEVYLTLGMREGGEIALFYNPEYVREVRFPVHEGCLHGFFSAVGLGIAWIGFVLRKEKRKGAKAS